VNQRMRVVGNERRALYDARSRASSPGEHPQVRLPKKTVFLRVYDVLWLAL
jgi:hypothetical protein